MCMRGGRALRGEGAEGWALTSEGRESPRSEGAEGWALTSEGPGLWVCVCSVWVCSPGQLP